MELFIKVTHATETTPCYIKEFSSNGTPKRTTLFDEATDFGFGSKHTLAAKLNYIKAYYPEQLGYKVELLRLVDFVKLGGMYVKCIEQNYDTNEVKVSITPDINDACKDYDKFVIMVDFPEMQIDTKLIDITLEEVTI